LKIRIFERVALSLILGSSLLTTFAFSASPTPGLLKAKQEAEAKGYIFFTSHDEILNKAKQEGNYAL
jgi:hypothetical protein